MTVIHHRQKMDPVSQQWRRSRSYDSAVILSGKTNRTEVAATVFATPGTLRLLALPWINNGAFGSGVLRRSRT